MKTNYHTHTPRCRHAVGSEEEYAAAAIRAGMTQLGFSDHTPWAYDSGYISDIRMTPRQLGDYVDTVRALQVKYRDQIQIHLGLECEYFPKYMGWLRRTVQEYGIDYLLLGAHFCVSDEIGGYVGNGCLDDRSVQEYVDNCTAAMESGLFLYFAHPDLFLRAYRKWDSVSEQASAVLCETAKKCGMPLEYNVNADVYQRTRNRNDFPHPEFWRLAAKLHCDVVVGYDAHEPSMLLNAKAADRAVVLLNSFGCKIVDGLSIPQGKAKAGGRP